MLSESFIASLLTSNAPQNTSSALKDVGICVYEFRPNSSLRTTLKKSSTDSNCLAVSASHIFAVQSGKAVINVYSRERGNHEATVPFPERIRSIAIAGGYDGGGIIVIGTEGGSLILWEVCTGRQVMTPAAHLQPVTSLVVDPTNAFILSGSEDSSIHVWSLPNLLSFSKPSDVDQEQSSAANAPIRTISHHSTAITSIVMGHSINRNNIAVSASRDGTAIVWEYRTGKVLHTYLLPAVPLCLTVDPVDRAVFVGYEDGSVQLIDFFKTSSVQNILYDTNQQSAPTQLSPNDRWLPPSPELGATVCLTLSYDGTCLLSGHKSGAVASWDIGRGRYSSTITNFNSAVTNLQMQVPAGLPQRRKRITAHNIVKPRHDHALSMAGDSVPTTYTFHAHLNSSSELDRPTSTPDEFSTSLTHPYFPSSLISEGLLELHTQEHDPYQSNTQPKQSEPGHSLDSNTAPQLESLEKEVKSLKKEVSTQESTRHANMAEIVKLRDHIASLEDYSNELLNKQQADEKFRLEKESKKEKRALKRREAWFEAEKKGQNGDSVVKKMEIDDGDVSSDVDDTSSEDF